MKKLLVLLCFLPLFGFGQIVLNRSDAGFEKKWDSENSRYEFYNDGERFSGILISNSGTQVVVKDGLHNGLYQEWYESGMLRCSGVYINGLNRDGVWRFWHENGNLSYIWVYNYGEIVSSRCFNRYGSEISCP